MFISTIDNNLVNGEYIEEVLVPSSKEHKIENITDKVYIQFLSESGFRSHLLLKTDNIPEDVVCLVMRNSHKHYASLKLVIQGLRQ